MAACEGLVQYDKTGVSTALNAVLELYAGKLARTVLRGPRFREEMRLPSRGAVVVGPRSRFIEGKLERDRSLRFSAPRLSDEANQQCDACEGLVQLGETGVSTTLNAVREPYAGKARTYGSSGAPFPRGNAATLYKNPRPIKWKYDDPSRRIRPVPFQ